METAGMNVRMAADRIGVSSNRIYALVKNGELHPTRLGGRIFFEIAEIDRYIESKQHPTGLFTTQEAADMMGVHLQYVYALVGRGKLNPTRVGARTFFNIKEIEENSPGPPALPGYFTITDAAACTGIPRASIQNMISEGRLGAVKSRGRWYISRYDLDDLPTPRSGRPKETYRIDYGTGTMDIDGVVDARKRAVALLEAGLTVSMNKL